MLSWRFHQACKKITATAQGLHTAYIAQVMHQPQPSRTRRAPGARSWCKPCRPCVPAHALLWNAEDTTPYECDGLTAYRQRPLVVCLPETYDAGASRAAKPATPCNVPVVARGAGTGLSGGAMPTPWA